MTSARRLMAMGAISAFIAVAMGAFGAHGLKNLVTEERQKVFETAARYQMYHALAMLAAAWVATEMSETWARRAGLWFLAGTVVFSGSLYALVLLDKGILGAITPLGGLAFLAGWICLAAAAFAHPPK